MFSRASRNSFRDQQSLHRGHLVSLEMMWGHRGGVDIPSWDRDELYTPTAKWPYYQKIDETAQHGLYGIVSRPTTILAGEAGPERVSITPLHRGAAQSLGGEEGYSPTFVFNIQSLTGNRAGAKTLGQLTAEEHLNELRRRGKTL